MVVDDAIVVLENVTTHIERGSEPKQASVHATNEVVRISVIASTLTMIAVFFPLTMVTGMSGVTVQLGWMMCAIMVSTVSALTFTPMLCSQLLRLQKQSKMFRIFFADSACAGRSWTTGIRTG